VSAASSAAAWSAGEARQCWGGELFHLCPERAAFLPEHRALLVADVHLGKGLSFRRLGVPVPGGTTVDTLQRLSDLIERCQAETLVLLGDFLHAADAQASPVQAGLSRWRERHAGLRVTLVRGNHDDRAGDPAPGLGFQVVDAPWRLGSLALAHHPQPIDGLSVVAGHVHPCVHVGRVPDRLRLPCFHFTPRVATLPAFGAFTGMHAVTPQPGEAVFAVAGDVVRRLPS
jgi:DNA ligase-associated metallophosphoesterase